MIRRPFQTLCGIALFFGGIGCKSGPPPMPRTFPASDGAGACRATTARGEVTQTSRWVYAPGEARELADETGDGQPDVIRIATLDKQGRVVQLATTSPDGTVLARESRAYDGDRLVRVEHDRLDGAGRPGSDGKADEIHILQWDGDRLIRETWDQLDASGVLGTDGTPEYATEWTWTNGQRTRGVKTDERDGAVLQTTAMVWVAGQLALETIDLGGDGSIDVTVKRSWADDRLQEVIVEGVVDSAHTRYEYCR